MNEDKENLKPTKRNYLKHGLILSGVLVLGLGITNNFTLGISNNSGDNNNKIVYAEDKDKESKSSKELKSVYDDLITGDWEIEYADWGISQGIIKLYNDNTIRVNEPLSESELIEMVGNYIGLKTDNVEKTYNDLRNLGIVVNGTMNKDYRSEVVNIDDGIIVAMSLFDKDDFKTRKSKVNEILKWINANDSAHKLSMEDELTKVDMLRILKAYSDNGNELVVSHPVFNIGDNWKESFIADKINKHVNYLELDSGLYVSVIELAEFSTDDDSLVDYVKENTGKSLKDYSNAKYIVTVKGLGATSIDLKGLSILVKDGAPKTYFETKENIVLGGKSSVVKVVEGQSISELAVIIGGKTLPIDLSSLKTLKTNRMFVEDNNYDKLNMVSFYLNDNIKDIEYQLEEVFSKEYNSDNKTN